MDLELTSEQALIRDTVREYSKKVIAPLAEETDQQKLFPQKQFDGLAQLGVLGALIPPEYGGSGIDKVSYCLAIEEIAYACAATAVTVAVHTSVAVTPILHAGTEEQKKRLLPPMADGSRMGAFALTEPEAGSDASAIKTRAVRDGDSWVLNGSKVFITNGSHAGHILVAAKTEDEAKGKDAITLFVVEKECEGFEVGGAEDKLGLRGSDTARLAFNDCRVPDANRIGEPGKGFKTLMATLNASRLGIAAQSLGIARRALDESLSYAKERRQFGIPIGKHQAIAFRLADMATRIEGARLLTMRAAADEDRGELRPEHASMAKLVASETCVWASNQAVQIHGGNGYIKDYVAERLMRDSKVTEIYEGTSEIQRTVIGRALVR